MTIREYLDEEGGCHIKMGAFLSAKTRSESGAWGPQCNATIASGLSAQGSLPPTPMDYSFYVLPAPNDPDLG